MRSSWTRNLIAPSLVALLLGGSLVVQPARAADSRWIRKLQEATTSLWSDVRARLRGSRSKWGRWFRDFKRKGAAELRKGGESILAKLGELWRKLTGAPASPPACKSEDCRKKSLMVRLYEPFDPELKTRVDAKGILRVDHGATAAANREAARAKKREIASLGRRIRSTRDQRRELRAARRKLRRKMRQDRLEAAYHGVLAAINRAIGRE